MLHSEPLRYRRQITSPQHSLGTAQRSNTVAGYCAASIAPLAGEEDVLDLLTPTVRTWQYVVKGRELPVVIRYWANVHDGLPAAIRALPAATRCRQNVQPDSSRRHLPVLP